MLKPIACALVAAILTIPALAGSKLLPANLRCEYRVDPLGIDETQPRLSWTLESAERGQKQTAYRVLVASDPSLLSKNGGDLWDSGRVESSQSIHVVYVGIPLKSQMRCFWKVRAWDKDGRPSPWSRPAMWSMGLLQRSDWHARWIGLDRDDETASRPNPLAEAQWIWSSEGDPAASAPPGSRYFRRTIVIPEGRAIQRAEFAGTTDNEFVLFINGREAGSGNDPRRTHESVVTEHLRAGSNVLAVIAKNTGNTPSPAGFVGVLRIEFAHGEPLVLATDQQWRVADKEVAGWETPQFDDSSWSAAKQLGPNGMKPWGEVNLPSSRRLTARMLRREFQVLGKVTRATAYVSGLGLFELYLNGRKVGDHVLEPALTDYAKRVLYVTFDITSQLQKGVNAVGVMLGNGRYFAPRLAIPISTRTYGYPKLLLQIRIECADGTTAEVVSDDNWKITTNGPIRANNEYDGEEYDARMEMDGWSRAGFDDSSWGKVQAVVPPEGAIAAQMIEPIRVTETISPVAVTTPQPGIFIYDMGQNLVGWCRLAMSGPKGTEVTLRHAEVLRDDGMLYLDNIRGAKVTDIYILKGQGVEVYEPRFTYHGFRYVEVRGFPGTPGLAALQGKVVHDAVQKVGEFSCSSPVLNGIYRNVVWGVRGNYRSIPTDCPQRDERQGWLGDRSAESRGETYLFDVAAFYGKWLLDMEDAQRENGSVPDVAPAFWTIYSNNVTWPSSSLIIPGALYDQYADLRILQKHYGSMKKWIEFMSGFLKDGLMPRDTYGDWCVPPESQKLIHSQDPKRKTAGELIGTAYFYYDLRLMARYAALLGKADDGRSFNDEAEALKRAFNQKYFNPDTHQYDNGSQTSSVLPLAFGMVPEGQRQSVFSRLVEKITGEGQGHIGTGLIGGQWLMHVLSDNGRADVAYTLASQKTYPSWGYMIEKGATTIWELWNGDTADPAMNSHNHVMLAGDLITWFYEYLAGIGPDPEQPGFNHILMRPHVTGDLQYAKASHQSPYGLSVSDWRIQDGRFLWDVTVPPNTTATLWVPAKDAADVTESRKRAIRAAGVRFLRMESGSAVFEVPSGRYSFAAPKGVAVRSGDQ